MDRYMIVDLPGSCVDRYGIPQIRYGSSKSDVKFLDDTSRKKQLH